MTVTMMSILIASVVTMIAVMLAIASRDEFNALETMTLYFVVLIAVRAVWYERNKK